jgi:hypothetical protein
MRIALLSFVVLALAATQAAAQLTPPGSRPPLRPYHGDKAPLVQVGASLGLYGFPKPTIRPTCEEYRVPCAEPGAKVGSGGPGVALFATGRITRRFGVMAQVTSYGRLASKLAETTIVGVGPLWTTVNQDRDGKAVSRMPFVSVLVGRGSAAFGASGPVLQVTAGLDMFGSTTSSNPELGGGVDVGCRVGAGGARHFTGCSLSFRASMGFGLR